MSKNKSNLVVIYILGSKQARVFLAQIRALSLQKIMDEVNSLQKVEAEFIYEVSISFEFVFILQFFSETMGIIDTLCQALQN